MWWFLPRDAMRKRRLCCHPVSISPYVHPSVCHVRVLYPDGWRYRQTSFSIDPVAHHFSFWHQVPVTNSMDPIAMTLSGGAKYTGVGKFAIFDWNRHTTEALGCHRTLIGSYRRRIDPCRFRWPWVTHNSCFKVTVYLQVEYLKNGAS